MGEQARAMSGHPRVSVIMVTADPHAPFVREAVDSVLNQSFGDWELIIVDDGPAGRVAEKVATDNDPRIRYMRQEHVGVKHLGVTYNRALSLAESPLIAILEGDDYWPSDKLEVQIPAFEESEAVLSYGVVEHVNASGQLLHDHAPSLKAEKEPGALGNSPVGRAAIAMARHWQYVSPASIVIRRSALESMGGFQQPVYYPAVDFPTVLRLATAGPFQYLPKVLGFGRQHQTSVTASVIPGKTYMLGMFRCWLETMRASDIRLSGRDSDQIVAHWRARFSGYYRMLGRMFLRQGEAKKARTHFLASLPGSTRMASLVALGGTFFSYAPGGSHFFEGCYKLSGRHSADMNDLQESVREATEIISAFEAWAGEVRSLCSGRGDAACLA
jgi:glycosyltransferase involved in cell wall biosynthesis